jgi:hypothetical protein
MYSNEGNKKEIRIKEGIQKFIAELDDPVMCEDRIIEKSYMDFISNKINHRRKKR